MGEPNMVADTKSIISFFDNMARENGGMISEYLSLKVLREYAVRFGTAYRREYDVVIPKDVIENVKR